MNNPSQTPSKYSYEDCLKVALSHKVWANWRINDTPTYQKSSRKKWLPTIQDEWIKANHA